MAKKRKAATKLDTRESTGRADVCANCEIRAVCLVFLLFLSFFFFLKNSFREKWIQDILKMGNFAGRRLNYNCDTGQLRNT